MNESVSTRIVRYEDGSVLEERPDLLAREEPLEIRIEGHTVTVTMRTPGCDRELVAGFLLTEGIVKSAKDIFDITTCVKAGRAGAGNVKLIAGDSYIVYGKASWTATPTVDL